MSGLWSSGTGRAYLTLSASIGLMAVIGMILLWPGGSPDSPPSGQSAETERAEVVSLAAAQCPTGIEGPCQDVGIRIDSGPSAGSTSTIEALGGPGTPVEAGLQIGQEVRVTSVELAPGQTAYQISDFERRGPLLWLGLLFGLLVVIFGRLRGALSLVGLAIGLAVILLFVVPAILDGSDPLWVALFGSLAAMIVTILLAHGANAKSVAAILGTAGSLLLVCLLASLAIELTDLTGLSSEESTYLSAYGLVDLDSFTGLVLAGMVIGALGVLDDVTVSQASTVMALRKANLSLGRRELYRRAIEVGRDHVSATVNTLVFAYVGASLPVLLILSSSGLGLVDGINLEIVAKEVVAMLVGSVGLICAVPITTAIAASLATRLEPELIGSGEGHSH